MSNYDRPKITVGHSYSSKHIGELMRGDFFTFPGSAEDSVYVVTAAVDCDSVRFILLSNGSLYHRQGCTPVVQLRLESAHFEKIEE